MKKSKLSISLFLIVLSIVFINCSGQRMNNNSKVKPSGHLYNKNESSISSPNYGEDQEKIDSIIRAKAKTKRKTSAVGTK